jgi:hypothetical protein
VWLAGYVVLPIAGVYEPIWPYDAATLWAARLSPSHVRRESPSRALAVLHETKGVDLDEKHHRARLAGS